MEVYETVIKSYTGSWISFTSLQTDTSSQTVQPIGCVFAITATLHKDKPLVKDQAVPLPTRVALALSTCITASDRAAHKRQVGNRGVCIKIQGYVWHAVKLWQRDTWNWRKRRTKALFSKLGCKRLHWYHKQHCKLRALTSKGSACWWERASYGSAWSSAWVLH